MENIREKEIDLKLKEYFKKMIEFVGYDYTLISISTEVNVKDSLSEFTSKFDEYSNSDLILSLIKSSIISGKSDNVFVRAMIDKKDFESLSFLINYNYGIRRAVTRDFISLSYLSNEQALESNPRKDLALQQLASLKAYQDKLNQNKDSLLIKSKSTVS